MIDSFDIFLGGPMGNNQDDGAGTSYSDHMTNMAAATFKIAEEIANEMAAKGLDQRIEILNPNVQATGDIVDRVFSMIDRAELGLIDISSRSPSAMYELTLMHAIGTPVVPIALPLQEGKELPFYLAGQYACLVPNFTVETLTEHLRPKIRMAMGLEDISFDPTSNPVTKFYGMPLLDISATSGLATGYFHNFLRHIAKETNSIFDRNPKFKSCVVLVPKSLDEIGGERYAAKHALEARGVKTDGELTDEPDQVRGQMFLAFAGNYIYDFPAPLLAMRQSPRYVRLQKDLDRATKERRRQEIEVLIERLEMATITRFVSLLKGFLKREGVSAKRVEFLSLDEFVARFD